MDEGLESRLIIHNIIKLTLIKSYNQDQSLIISTKNKKISINNKRFIYNASLTSIRQYFLIKKIIYNLVKKIDENSDTFILLLSALSQILFLKIKEYAVVNSTVELCEIKNIRAPKSLINACLRNYLRNKSIYNNYCTEFIDFPKWFLSNTKNITKKQKELFVNNISKHPTLHIVLKKKANIKNYINYGKATSKKSIGIHEKYNFNDIPNFKKGEWWVQDFSAMLPLNLISIKKFENIADVCSAPGGKLFQILCDNKKVSSYENDKKRLLKLNKNLKRLNYNLILKNSDFFYINKNKKFDLIVLDAPCSAVGTIRRNPDILIKKNFPNLKYLTQVQKEFLDKSKLILKKNGILIYMVCSFLEIETVNQIESFLDENRNFSILPFSPEKNNIAKDFIDKKGFINTLPKSILKDIMVDGFFAAKLIKNYEI